VLLTWTFANCLTTAAPQFVSRNASIPIAVPSGTVASQVLCPDETA